MTLADSRIEVVVESFLTRLHAPEFSELAGAVTRRGDRRADVPRDTSSVWTNVLLNVVLSMGTEDGWTTYPARRYWSQGKDNGRNSSYDGPRPQPDDRGEYLFDACWTTYPRVASGWTRALENGPGLPQPRLVLSCECEWAERPGPDRSGETRAGRILDDFAKLVDAPARHRLMMFSYWDDLRFDRIVGLCSRLATPFGADDAYALIGWHASTPWEDRASARVQILRGGR